MDVAQDGQPPIKSRPGPKPRGRTVAPLTITVTPAQRAALEEMADAQRVSISAVIRRFIAVGLAANTAHVPGRGTGDEGAPGDPLHEPSTIAVIDDDPRVVAFVTLVLEDEGHRVATWHTGAGARDFIVREMPAAVVLDVEMETRDAGLQVLEEILGDVSICAVPIILTSSQTRIIGETSERQMRFGDRILAKPYTAEALIAAVAGAIAAGQRHGAGAATRGN